MTTLRFSAVGHKLLGSRYLAKHFREKIERALQAGEGEILLDFTEVDAITDSFADELIGALIATSDRPVLELLRFKGCNQNVRGAIQALLADVVNRRAAGA